MSALDEMLSKTTISAIRTLLLLGRQSPAACWSPRRLAVELEESPTYLAKVVRHLVKAGILEAEKGAKGGVRLLKQPRHIRLIEVVEACQGAIIGDFCKAQRSTAHHCPFHAAAVELHLAITGVLSRWTLAALLDSAPGRVGSSRCLMAGVPSTQFDKAPGRTLAP